MRTAVIQSDIKFEDKKYNLKKAEEFIKKAASDNVDIIFFPEMSFTGFSMNIRLTAETDAYTINRMSELARRYAVHIGFGYVRLNDGYGENRYAVIDSNGNVVSNYIKIHSFAIGGEREDFRSGATLPSPVFVSGQSISTFICYDLRFPEIFRAVCDKSTVITVAANWPASRSEHWTTLLRARAIENQVYIIGINCTGNQDGLIYSGDSMVIDPTGTVLALAKPHCEELLICDIPDNTAALRESFPVLKSRKFDLYRNFT